MTRKCCWETQIKYIWSLFPVKVIGINYRPEVHFDHTAFSLHYDAQVKKQQVLVQINQTVTEKTHATQTLICDPAAPFTFYLAMLNRSLASLQPTLQRQMQHCTSVGNFNAMGWRCNDHGRKWVCSVHRGQRLIQLVLDLTDSGSWMEITGDIQNLSGSLNSR